MLLTDWGFYFHLSQLVKSLEEYQYIQVLFILADFSGSHHDVNLRALPKLLSLPNQVSYAHINEFVTAFEKLHSPLTAITLRDFFKDFLRDPARSGGFYHDPAPWHTFAATRFLQFLATTSSR